MKKVLFFSVALVATGLQGSGDGSIISPVKVLVQDDALVQPVPLSSDLSELSDNSSFPNADMQTPSRPGISPEERTPSCGKTQSPSLPVWFASAMKTICDSQGRITPVDYAIPVIIVEEIDFRAECLKKEQRSMDEIARLFAKQQRKLTDIQRGYEIHQTLLKNKPEFDGLGGWASTCATIVNASK